MQTAAHGQPHKTNVLSLESGNCLQEKREKPHSKNKDEIPLSTLEEIELDCANEEDSFAPLSTLPSLKYLRLVEAPLRSLSDLAGCDQLVSLKLMD